jgi:hypothetical protein
MKAQARRLVPILLLLVIVYLAAGASTYLYDRAQDWCNARNHWEAVFWYAIIWPLRIGASCGIR